MLALQLMTSYGMKPDELRALRESLGLTQEKLAYILGVDRRTVIRWEVGDVPVTNRIRLFIMACLQQHGYMLLTIVTYLYIIATIIDCLT